MRRLGLGCLAIAAALSLASPAEARHVHKHAAKPIAPKVMVIAMIPPEAAPWLKYDKPTIKVSVPGIPAELPFACTPDGLCVMTVGMGYANAASSISALVYSHKFDLRRTYFLIDGIAGVDPKAGTLGSVHWARYAVDTGLRHEIDPRQMPADWSSSFVALGGHKPGDKPVYHAQTEVFQLNEALLQKAYALSRDVPLMDTPEAATYRQHYTEKAALSAPFVSICDTASDDIFWYGSITEKKVADFTALMSDSKASYCTTQMEDNATLTALARGTSAGLVDMDRVAVLRSASDFDREGKDQGVAESMGDSTGYPLAVENGYRVGAALAHAIVGNWPKWSKGVPNN